MIEEKTILRVQVNTRDGTPEDDALANIDMFGLGNREQSILALAQMTEEERGTHIGCHRSTKTLKNKNSLTYFIFL